MSYRLNKTNGELLTDLVDGQIDITSTDLTLVGRNYKGFGEYLNENFIGLLENFASTSAPSNPITGQLWFDTAELRLKLYDGTTFKAAGGPIVSNQQPNMVAGDLWIDNENNQLWFFDGTDRVLVGPEYTAGQRKTGFEVQTVIDSVSAEKTVLKLFIAGVLVGVFTDSTFRVDASRAIPGYPQDPNDTASPKRQLFQTGFNPVGANFWYRGTADNARALTNEAGVSFTEANFMQTAPTTGFTSTTGAIKIKNNAGLSVGIGDNEYAILKVDAGTLQTILETQLDNTDMSFKVKVGNTSVAGVFIDGGERRVGIWNTTPTVELDVDGNGRYTGDLEVEGNLTVQGEATYLNVSTLRVEDKNIELALLDDSTEGNDAAADGAGIIVRSTQGSKDLIWIDATKSWTSNQDFNLITSLDNPTPAYKINGAEMLTATTLNSSVTSATGLTEIGTLVNLDVDNTNINGTTITTTGTGLTIISAADIAINNVKLTGVAEPVDAQDASTKNYVDTQIDADNIGFALDITGLTTPYTPGVNTGPTTDVAAILQVMYPANTKNGARAIIHCTNYTGINITIAQADLATVISDPKISVDKDGVFSTESVVQDVSVSGDINASTTLSPDRYTMTFESNGISWSHISTSTYIP